MYYVTDTHSLIWFLTDDKRLGKNALEIFNNADDGKEIIIVPTIVLAEIIYLCEKRRVKLNITEVKVIYNLNPDMMKQILESKENISQGKIKKLDI